MKTLPFAAIFLSLLIATCIAAPALAGDGNPFPPKRFTFELDSPFIGNPEYKFKSAKLSMEFGPDSDGKVSWEVKYAHLKSLVIELGATRLTVPAEILHDVQHLTLGDLSFTWCAGSYYLSLSAGLEPNASGMMQFVWTDGNLTGLTVDGRDMRLRYPKVFDKK